MDVSEVSNLSSLFNERGDQITMYVTGSPFTAFQLSAMDEVVIWPIVGAASLFGTAKTNNHQQHYHKIIMIYNFGREVVLLYHKIANYDLLWLIMINYDFPSQYYGLPK